MYLDLDAWPRRATFEHYRTYERPFFSLTAPVDCTATRAWCKAHDASFSLACWFAVLDAVRPIEAFHLRLRGGRVWRHETLSLAVTVLAADESLRFCRVDGAADFVSFLHGAKPALKAAAEGPPRVDDQRHRDDVLFGTMIPWLAFTGITHARRDDPEDSIPRLAFGKVTAAGARAALPFSVEAHHALVDGLHVGRLFERLEAAFADPERTFAWDR